jgi:DNA-binding NarL/FixJ family response regulator
MNMPKIRVLVADDHALVREGISALLGFCNDIEVVGEASDGIEAIERTRAVKPDIVLMDIGMPRLGGLEATVELRKTEPDVKIIILTYAMTGARPSSRLRDGGSLCRASTPRSLRRRVRE